VGCDDAEEAAFRAGFSARGIALNCGVDRGWAVVARKRTYPFRESWREHIRTT
jgi:hypothetical protein